MALQLIARYASTVAGARRQLAAKREVARRQLRRSLRRAKLAGMVVALLIAAGAAVGWFVPLIDELRHRAPSVEIVRDLGDELGPDRLRPIEGHN
jgi:hypothetical protein